VAHLVECGGSLSRMSWFIGGDVMAHRVRYCCSICMKCGSFGGMWWFIQFDVVTH
jgi:hypothetical protein